MFVSGGALVSKSVTLWEGTPATYDSALNLRGFLWSSYSALYRDQLWVAVVVNKRAGMVSRLPLKVYARNAQGGRDVVPDHPFAQLLRRPNVRQDPFTFWTWTSSTFDIYGEAFWLKVRDAGGRPVQLLPAHPTRMVLEDDGTWTYRAGNREISGIRREHVVHFSAYNPDNQDRGMSRLEPLRATLENEWHARNATSSFWQRGARPGTALTHPGTLSQGAQDRLRLQYDAITAGSGNTGATVVLEEGMTPKPMTLTAEEAQYIETRKLNREEVVAVYDMPPPAVHILDRATFSNITEQFRSVYRDTMAPVLGYFEAVMETQLRAPDFGDEVYAEFLMDEVLRGDFETRQDALGKANYMTLAEKRQIENLPFIEGTDRIFLNAAEQPMTAPQDGDAPAAPPFQQVGLPALIAAGVISEDDARRLLGIPGVAPGLPAVPVDVPRSVMGRIGRAKSMDDIDLTSLTANLPDPLPVIAAFAASKAAGEDLAAFKTRLRALTETE